MKKLYTTWLGFQILTTIIWILYIISIKKIDNLPEAASHPFTFITITTFWLLVVVTKVRKIDEDN